MRVRLRGKFPRGAGEVAAVSRRKGRARRVGGRTLGFAVPLAERHKKSSTVCTAKATYQASGTRSARYLAYRTLLSRIGSFLTRRSCACISYSFALAITPGWQTQHCYVWSACYATV